MFQVIRCLDQHFEQVVKGADDVVTFQDFRVLDDFRAEFFDIARAFEIDHNESRHVVTGLAAADFGTVAFDDAVVFHLADAFGNSRNGQADDLADFRSRSFAIVFEYR